MNVGKGKGVGKEKFVRQPRLRDVLDATAVFACEVAMLAFFWKSSHLLGTVDYSHFEHWLQVTAPGRALGALARLLGLAVSAWLLATSLLYALAALSGKRTLLRSAGRLTVPFVRRAVDALAVVSVTASTIGTASGAAFAAPARLAPIVQPLGPIGPARSMEVPSPHLPTGSGPGGLAGDSPEAGQPAADRTRPHDQPVSTMASVSAAAARVGTAAGRHLPHPGALAHDPPVKGVARPLPRVVPSVENHFAGLPKGTKVVVVKPGDCLSVIAEKYLGDWRLDTEIAELNYGRPQPDGLALVDDHWIYPGWVLIMPADAHGTLVVGEPGSPEGLLGHNDHPHPAKPGSGGREWTRRQARPGPIGAGEHSRQGGTWSARAERERLLGDGHTEPAAKAANVNGACGPHPSRGRPPAGLFKGTAREALPAPESHEAGGHGEPAHRGTLPPQREAPGRSGASTYRAQPSGGAGAGQGIGARPVRKDGPAGVEANSRGVRREPNATGGREQSKQHSQQARENKVVVVEPAGGATAEAPQASGTQEHGALGKVEAVALAGLGALAAAGLVWRLGRTRRERTHGRPRGFVVARNRPEVEAAERRARAVASEEAMRWVDLGCRYLGALIEQEALDAGVTQLLRPVSGTEASNQPAGQDGGHQEGHCGLDEVPVSSRESSEQTGLGGVALFEEGPFGTSCELEQDQAEADAFETWWLSDGHHGVPVGSRRTERGGASNGPGEDEPAGDVGSQGGGGNQGRGEGTGQEGLPQPSAVPGKREVPSLVMVRVGACGLEVVLEPAPSGRLGWFVRGGPAGDGAEEPTTYVLGADISLHDLETLAAERWPAWPALVAIGASEKGTVLVNLEHAGVLSVEGPAERVEGFLAGVLLQLASEPWAEEMLGGLYEVGESPLKGRLAGVVQGFGAEEAMELAEKLDAVSSARQGLAGGCSLSVMRAVACEALPNVVVAFAGTPANTLRCLAEAAVPERSGVALVAAGPVVGAAWKLELAADSGAVLRGRCGDGEVVVELTSAFRSEEVALLSEALSGPEGEEFVKLDGEAGEGEQGVPAGGPSPEGDGAARAVVEAPPVEIRFLGPVDVVGGDMDALGSSRIMAALGLIAYLAAHPRPVSADELASALWPLDVTRDNFGGPQRKTVMNVVSRARSVLGYGHNGKERIVLTPRGYRLATDVGSDWDRFSKHVSLAHSLGGGPGALGQLRDALELVRGEPFGGVLGSQFFEWVASENLDMVISARVVDVAEELGELALGSGDLALVFWAVEKGLQIEPTREELFRLWMHALGREGRPAKVDDVYRRLKLVLRQRIHPLQEPQPASREVWQRYVAMEGATGL